MNKTSLKTKLSSKHLGRKITLLDRTDSTNKQAKAYCETVDIINGHLFIAQEQTHGKGTDGNVWESLQGNLYFSAVFEYDKKVTTTFSLYPAVALAKVLNEKYNIEAHVKWPNDVLVGQQKIAGILCEGAYNHYIIMGMGVNLNQTAFPSSLEHIATSVKSILGTDVDIEEFTAVFTNQYDELFYSNIDICKAWTSFTKMTNKVITSSNNGIESKVTVKGISPEGYLRVQHANGDIENWMARSGLDISTDY